MNSGMIFVEQMENDVWSLICEPFLTDENLMLVWGKSFEQMIFEHMEDKLVIDVIFEGLIFFEMVVLTTDN